MGLLLLASIIVAVASAVSLDVQPNLDWLGKGYNILEGNPDSKTAEFGTVDPGIRGRIFELSYDDHSVSTDGKYPVPDQVVFTPFGSCDEIETGVVFEGTLSYQNKLLSNVETCGTTKSLFDGFQFSLSKCFEQVRLATEHAGFVFNDQQTLCTFGRARLATESAQFKNFRLSRDFVSDACALPVEYNNQVYMSFLTKWGTDFVIEVDVGRRQTERYRSTSNSIVQAAVKQDSSLYNSKDGVITLDIDKFRPQLTFDMNTFTDRVESAQYGDEIMSQPIAMKIVSIREVFGDAFWQLMGTYLAEGLCGPKQDIAQKQQNIHLALAGYSIWRGAVAAQNPIIQSQVTWPVGTYSLPMVDSTLSCPGTPFYWSIGYRIQDTEDLLPSNDWPKDCHLKGPYTWSMVQLNFCSKVNYYEDEYEWEFPAGEYCVYKKGSSCPPGLKEGYVMWDDEELLNSNEVHGIVPEGVYDKDTLIYFCCRDDGSYTSPINLPVQDPFYLFQKNSRGCQQVNGMKVNEEWFHWDGEDDLFKPPNFFFGSTPHNFGRDNDHKLGFCYYYV